VQIPEAGFGMQIPEFLTQRKFVFGMQIPELRHGVQIPELRAFGKQILELLTQRKFVSVGYQQVCQQRATASLFQQRPRPI